MNNLNIFKNKKVLVTGHTGFKGSWLCLILQFLGAKVYGLSNNIVSIPSNYSALNLKKNIKEFFFDLSDLKKTKNCVSSVKPDFIFHLAAQAIVKESYLRPIKTWKTNLFGTLSLLESLRDLKKKCTVVIITSDKVYKNLELERGYKENDILGGDDPYSASKCATETLINSYIKSFILKRKSNVALSIATPRTVIGGGDRSEGRLIPDCVRCWVKNKKIIIRNPNSTRPWQHVFEVLIGYLILAKKLKKNPKKFHGQVFNFGPSKYSKFKVIQILKIIRNNWKKVTWLVKKNKNFKETNLLKLNSKKASKLLNWQCIIDTKKSIQMTLNWYQNFYEKRNEIKKFSIDQLKDYFKILKKKNICK